MACDKGYIWNPSNCACEDLLGFFLIRKNIGSKWSRGNRVFEIAWNLIGTLLKVHQVAELYTTNGSKVSNHWPKLHDLT